MVISSVVGEGIGQGDTRNRVVYLVSLEGVGLAVLF